MRLDIVVRNSQDNIPIPGAKVTVYYNRTRRARGGLGAETEKVFIATNQTVKTNGRVSMEVPAVATYIIQIWADGFITETNAHYIMKCTWVCDHTKLITLSPELPPGQ